jgi:uncharacterized membrane protein
MADGRGAGAQAGEQLAQQARELVSALAERAVGGLESKASGLTSRLSDYAEGSGPGLAAAVKGVKAKAEGGSPLTGALSGGASAVKNKIGEAVGSVTGKGKGGGGGGGKQKVTNIVEQIDVGVPIRVAYNQWTQFQDFPEFTKKVESADQKDEQKLTWRAQIFFSHRTWESTIVEQVPDERIVWRSQGAKGHVDGAVTFHELGPNLTRILLVLEYHPQGFFEHVGNLWRAQGRRVRLELKHFQRHVMTRTILAPDEVEGWRGEIRDSEVVRSHEDAMRDEREDEDTADAEDEDEDAYADEDEDTEDEESEEDEFEDDEDEDTEDEDEPEDDEDEADEDDDYEDEDDEPTEDRRPRGRGRASTRRR